MQQTYDHEAKHIENARIEIQILTGRHMPPEDSTFNTLEECKEVGAQRMKLIMLDWNVWDVNESIHINPESPKPSEKREGVLCEY